MPIALAATNRKKRGPYKKSADEFEPERLPDAGSAPAAGVPTPNPSHPVRSHIVAPTWRRVGPPAPEVNRYCRCGMLLPSRPRERCEYCGRLTGATLTPLTQDPGRE